MKKYIVIVFTGLLMSIPALAQLLGNKANNVKIQIDKRLFRLSGIHQFLPDVTVFQWTAIQICLHDALIKKVDSSIYLSLICLW